MKTIPENPLKQLREKHKLTVKDVSLRTNIPLKALQAYETPNLNHDALKAGTVRKLAGLFSISVDELLSLLDTYKELTTDFKVQEFVQNLNNAPVPYTCIKVYCNYQPKTIGVLARNFKTNEESLLTRTEIISLVQTGKVKFDNLTVSRNNSIRVRHKVPCIQTHRYDDYIPYVAPIQ